VETRLAAVNLLGAQPQALPIHRDTAPDLRMPSVPYGSEMVRVHRRGYLTRIGVCLLVVPRLPSRVVASPAQAVVAVLHALADGGA